MLRLVHPPPPGAQETRPSKGRRSPALSLTADEARHFRAALNNIARAYGGRPALAAVVGVPVETLHAAVQERRRPSPALALRVARAAGMSVEAMLSGHLSEAGRCNACGSRIGAGRVAS